MMEILKQRCSEILSEDSSPFERLRRLSCYLHGAVDRYDWFGFYITVSGRRELVLGPFAGEPTEHLRIPYGRGICGQAADRKDTILVDDVSAQDNYLACSLKVRSEIVVPVYSISDGSTVVGEIDIDSHKPRAFGEDDRSFLGELAAAVAADVAALSTAAAP